MRTHTNMNYQAILNGVKAYIAEHYDEDVSLDDYLKHSMWSRRSVQRALSHHNTGWRKLLAEERDRHE